MRRYYHVEELAPGAVPPDPAASDELSEDSKMSMEEASIIVSEANASADNARSLIEQTDRLVDVADGLNDISIVNDGIDAMTQNEARILNAVGDLAVAGTDISPEAIIPSMESFIGMKYASEGFVATSRKIEKATNDHAKETWESIDGFFRINATLPYMLTRIVALQHRADSIGKPRPDRETIKLRVAPSSLMMAGQVCTKPSDLKAALNNTKDSVNYVFKQYPDYINKKIESVIKALGSVNPDNPKFTITELADNLDAITVPTIPKAGTPMTIGDQQVWVGAPMLGNVELSQRLPAKKDTGTEFSRVNRHRWSTVTVTSRESPPSTGTPVVVNRLTQAEIKSLLADCRSILVDLDAFYRRGAFAKIKSMRKRMEAATDRLAADVSKEKENQALYNAYQTMANFNNGYASMVQSPLMVMFQKALASVRSVSAVCSSSIDGYEAKE